MVDDARKGIARSGSSHRQFIKKYFQADLEDPVNYDIVVNTVRLVFEDISSSIIRAMQEK
jgi:cytidylate kinase